MRGRSRIAEKPAFRDAFKYRRCLVPASGFYEWADARAADRSSPSPRCRKIALIAFAGLWETWHGADGSEIDTATIVTTDANDFLRPIHDRMPVVLAPGGFSAWLSRDTDPADALALLKPAPEDFFQLVPVSTRVNSADNDDPALLDRDDNEPSESEAAKPAEADPRQMRLF